MEKRFQTTDEKNETTSSTNWLHDGLVEIYNNSHDNPEKMVDEMCVEMFEYGRLIIRQIAAKGGSETLDKSIIAQIEKLGRNARLMMPIA